MGQFAGKHIVINGGSSGIGLAVAQAANPLGRMGSAEEAAAVAAFLADEASFVTGSDYAVDGGEAQL